MFDSNDLFYAAAQATGTTPGKQTFCSCICVAFGIHEPLVWLPVSAWTIWFHLVFWCGNDEICICSLVMAVRRCTYVCACMIKAYVHCHFLEAMHAWACVCVCGCKNKTYVNIHCCEACIKARICVCMIEVYACCHGCEAMHACVCMCARISRMMAFWGEVYLRLCMNKSYACFIVAMQARRMARCDCCEAMHACTRVCVLGLSKAYAHCNCC